MTKLILLFCALVPAICAECTRESAEPRLKRAIYEFSVNLLTRIAQENEYHFVASPLSAWTLLSCASLGAADQTLKEMKQVLQLQSHKCYNYKYLEIANSVTTVNETDVFLEKSSVIFVDDQMSLLKSYKDKFLKIKSSRIETVSFNNIEETAATINKYINRATHETIDDIVTPSDLEDIRMVMIDALYFKGSWSIPFIDAATVESTFYDHLENPIGNVSLMYNKDEYNITTLGQIDAQVLELPYGQSEWFSMLIFLPLKGIHLSKVIDKLKFISIQSIKNLFIEYGPSSVNVMLPRFKITSDLTNLQELLMDMGMRAAFDSYQASFPHISDESLHISTFIQKADIEVTEQGTVASAATAAGFGFRSSTIDFTVNKPFLFMIIDRKTDIPIFTGAFSKPTIY